MLDWKMLANSCVPLIDHPESKARADDHGVTFSKHYNSAWVLLWFRFLFAMESCGNVCNWTLCGEWLRPNLGPGLFLSTASAFNILSSLVEEEGDAFGRRESNGLAILPVLSSKYRPVQGLCQQPRSNCIREEFLDNLHVLPLEEREPLWIYFAGDSTGRQLWAAFLKDVANINLGNTKQEVKKLVNKCPKAPKPDKDFERFVNAQVRQAGLMYPKWTTVGGHACDWIAIIGQRPVRVTFDFRRPRQ